MQYVIFVGGFGCLRYFFFYFKKKFGDEIEIF